MKRKLLLVALFCVFTAVKVFAATTVTASTGGFNATSTTYGTAGGATTFTVSGTNLVSTGITVTAPSGFEVSTNGTTYTSSVVAGSAPTVTNATIYLRLTATAAAGGHSGTITCANNGVNTNVSIYSGNVSTAAVTITASISRSYGTALSSGSITTGFTATGLKNGESIGSVSISYYNDYQANTAVNTYTGQAGLSNATGGTFNSSNYGITYSTVTMIVTAVPLTITANSVSKSYGTLLTGGSGSTAFTFSGQQNSETIGSVTITYGTGSAANAAVGTYNTNAVVASSPTGGSLTASNYNITYVNGNITVGAATLTITGGATKVYGTTLTSGAGSTNFTSSGLLSPETIGSVTMTYGSGAASTATAGGYLGTATPSLATGGTFTASNYNIVYVAGNIIVTSKVLTVTSPAVTSKTYDGTTTATITGTLSGVVSGDVVTLAGTGTYASANVGTGITVTSTATLSGANAANYTLTQPTGLTGNITKAALTLTATGPQYDKTQSMGTTTSSTNFTYTGTVNGETITSVTLTPNKTGTQSAGTTYTVAPSAPTGPSPFAASNYTITPVNFSGTVGYQYTWTGNTGILWNFYGNWTGGATNGIPTANDNVIIPATFFTPTVNVTSTCGNVSITGSTTIYLLAALTSTGQLSIGGNTFTLQFSGLGGTAATATFGGLTDIGYQSTMVVNNGATVTFATNSRVNNISSQNAIANAGNLNFSANSVVTLGYACSVANTGTLVANSTTFQDNGGTSSTVHITNSKIFNATSCIFNFNSSAEYFTTSGTAAVFTTKACTFNIIGSAGNTFTNDAGGIYRDHGSTFNLEGSTAGFINASSSASSMILHGTAINLTTGGSNAEYIYNHTNGVMQADSGASISLIVASTSMTNDGILNAGISNSPCTINLSGTTTSLTNTGTFNLGSTSIINPSGTNCTVNSNGGVFTLESDQYGSASFGQAGSGATITGSTGYHVQRYVKGNSSLTYRGYRLFSSPVNASTSTSGGGYVALKYLTTTSTIIDPNANGVTSAANVYGAYTGGPSGGGFTSTGGFSNPTIYLYDEHQTSSTSSFTAGKTPGVAAINYGSNTSGVTVKYGSAAAVGYNVPVGNGYLMYFIGNNQATSYTTSHLPEDTYITATGYINQQTVPVTIWWSGSTYLSDATTGSSGGYNLLGNPYPSTIDLNKVCSDNGYTIKKFATLSDVTGQWAYWVLSTSGSTITSAIGSDATYSSEYVASGQGFLVQAPSTTQTVSFYEDQKVYNPLLLNNAGTSPTPGLMSVPQGRLQLADNATSAALRSAKPYTLNVAPKPGFALLHLVFTRDSVTSDGIALCFGSAWSDKYDGDDALDLDGSSKIYLSSYSADGQRLAINRESDYTTGKRVKLYVRGATDGQYTLSMHDISNVDTSVFNVYLVDNLKNDSLDMVRYGSYVFNSTASDTASYDNRFVLAIEKKALAQYKLVTFAGQKATTGILVNWKTYNEGDFTGFVLQKQDAGGTFSELYNQQSNGGSNYSYTDPNPLQGNNVYRLQQNDINGNITYSNTITIVYGTVSTNPESLSVYPNPSKSTITISVNAAPAGATGYTANIYNAAGMLIGNKAVSSTSWNQDISGYKPGIYVLELKTSEGNLVGKSKFVKSN